MNTHKLVIGALVLTGAGLAAQAAVSADAQQTPAADAQMEAQHHDASMNMDEAKADDAITDAVANTHADTMQDSASKNAAMEGMTAKERVMKEAASAGMKAQDTTMEEAAAPHAHAMPADMPMDDMPMPAAHDTTAPADAMPMHDEQSNDKLHSMTGGHEMHAHHHDMAPGTTRTTADYTLPPVTLVRDDGKAVSLVDELNDGRPVVLTFIYTSCTTICPMISQTLEQLQEELGSERDKVHIVSISIDPEEDTPARLKAYAERFGAGPQWQYYTGTVEASIAAQRAFNVYRGDKMNHTAVAFFRAAPGKPWLRLDGLATPDELLSAYHEVIGSNGS
ncbi:SCO family protein [Paraburkholderia diazotrophica]|uniref:Protein SCO1/2 n=1 Tax=Paraburkholderia diazotrophica TaxID=667676 RepID=A0A1H7E7P5_9BURK|nr:protein SCO1/2 [Paraburkholderia diazotrophica]